MLAAQSWAMQVSPHQEDLASAPVQLCLWFPYQISSAQLVTRWESNHIIIQQLCRAAFWGIHSVTRYNTEMQMHTHLVSYRNHGIWEVLGCEKEQSSHYFSTGHQEDDFEIKTRDLQLGSSTSGSAFSKRPPTQCSFQTVQFISN